MPSKESEDFYALPPLTIEIMAARDSGERLGLLMLVYTEEGAGITYPVEYVHRELVYRTPGRKDAVAFGKARFYVEEDLQDVRILFSRPNKTATMKGLSPFDGPVKLVDSKLKRFSTSRK